MLNPFSVSLTTNKGYWNSPMMFSGARTPPISSSKGGRRYDYAVVANRTAADKSGVTGGYGGYGWMFRNSKDGTSLKPYHTPTGPGPTIRAYGGEDKHGNTIMDQYIRGTGARDTGWALTLTKSKGSNKNQTKTKTLDKEVISTSETRAKASLFNPIEQFVALPQHGDSPNLNPTLAQMYATTDTMKKRAQRVTDRLLR